MSAESDSIAAEKYVVITTYRRSGDAVPAPVWIAPMSGGRAGFTTDGDSGKVKRIRNNSAVTLQACNVRGTVRAGAPIVHATAEVVTGDGYADVEKAIKSKYWIVYAIISIPQAVKKLFRKQQNNVGVVVTFTDEVAPTRAEPV